MLKKILIICLFVGVLNNGVFASDGELSNGVSDSIMSKREVNSFDDIGRYLSRKKVRHIYASSGSPHCGESPDIEYKPIRGFYNRLGKVIDSLDLID